MTKHLHHLARECPDDPEPTVETPAFRRWPSLHRTEDRIVLVARVTGTSQSCFFVGTTANVSDGGVFIETPTPPEIGAAVVVRVELDGAEPGRVIEHGRVAWHKLGPDGRPTGCGVSFSELDEEQKAMLAWMMSQVERDPLLCEL